MRVHIFQAFDDDWVARLGERLDSSIELKSGQSKDDAGEYNILVAGRPDLEWVESAGSLHTLVIPWAGIPEVTRTLMLEYPDIAVHNLHHNAAATAEMAISLLLASAKQIINMDHQLRRADWRAAYYPDGMISLEGKKLLVLGYGAIGKRVARTAQALGMTVTAMRRNAGASQSDVAMITEDQLDSQLPQYDAVVVCLPHTPKTDGLLSTKRLSLLKDNSILVNIARGKIIDEHGLFDQLSSGRIRAGLDVWYNYPKNRRKARRQQPSNFKFYKLDNVVMTPHIGGNAVDIEETRIAHLADLLNKAAKGDQLPNRVDLTAGY
jgi:phosphoglycerate dehydrogenase-like enzyme